MLDSPMLVDQNMVCASNTDQRDHFPRIHLVSLFSGIHQMYVSLLFPLIHPCKVSYCIHAVAIPQIRMNIYIYIYISYHNGSFLVTMHSQL